ncbi:MAG: hypothetical protein GF400_03690 [Candidatus Eisenbacteria bacterium]|nr:hypothetical protein [Candidatus Eisenbacteria bacterium]
MDLITTHDLEELARRVDGPRVSIYMPTHRTVPEVEQDRIRLKNLAGKAEDRLEEGGHRRKEIEPIVAPLRKLVANDFFWNTRSDGLAVFAGPEGLRTYKLPASFEPSVAVSPRYLLKPLIGFLASDGRYFVLALSRGSVRLFQASKLSVSEVDLENAPSSLAEALRFDDPESQLQFHTGTTQRRDGPDRKAMYHGHGVGTDDEDSNTLRFLTKVDRGLQSVLANERVPLVLAGVKDLQAAYRQVNTYQQLAERGIDGNPDKMSGKELHEASWTLVEPIFKEGLRKSLEQYRALDGEGSELAVDKLKDVVVSAQEGRVGTLFVARYGHAWGTFDPESVAVVCHDRPDDTNIDLLDFAAVRSFATKAAVYAIPEETVPGDGAAAAVLRF